MNGATKVAASLFGLGYAPFAPGTFGTAGAAVLYWLFLRRMDAGEFAVFCAAFAFASVFVCGRAAVVCGEKDPQKIVMDEAAGFFTAMLPSSGSGAEIIAGFVLFRLFDIAKPAPARRLERLPGGWGIVLDDLYAGILAAAGVFALRYAGVV